MTTHTITRALALAGSALAFLVSRLVALVAGCIFVACAAAVLFKDVVLHAAPVTLDHVLTAGVLSGTLLVGKLLMTAWTGRHWLAVGGFAVLFAVGTGLIVYQSSGKQAEDTFQSHAEADFAATERDRIKPLLDQAEAMLASAAGKIDKDCVHGWASKAQCDGLRATHAVYTAAVAGHNAALEKLGPPRTVAPEAENFANVASVFGADKDMVKAGAVLIVPFIRTVLFELGALWCFAFAFRPVGRKATGEVSSPVAEQPRQPLPIETAQTSFHADDLAATRATIIGGEPGSGNWGNDDTDGSGEPGNPGNGGKRVYSKAEALLDLTRRLASGETVPSQETLAQAWAVHPGTASKWLKRWRKDGHVPAAQRVGRCHVLRSPEALSAEGMNRQHNKRLAAV